jgi:hypothetical protein
MMLGSAWCLGLSMSLYSYSLYDSLYCCSYAQVLHGDDEAPYSLYYSQVLHGDDDARLGVPRPLAEALVA